VWVWLVGALPANAVSKPVILLVAYWYLCSVPYFSSC
jgi:hypothetical protein